jgi:hypothetical protein
MDFPERVVTERLVLRRWREDDRAAFQRLWADQDVWRALRPGAPFDHAYGAQRLAHHLDHWARHGFGLCRLAPAAAHHGVRDGSGRSSNRPDRAGLLGQRHDLVLLGDREPARGRLLAARQDPIDCSLAGRRRLPLKAGGRERFGRKVIRECGSANGAEKDGDERREQLGDERFALGPPPLIRQVTHQEQGLNRAGRKPSCAADWVCAWISS